MRPREEEKLTSAMIEGPLEGVECLNCQLCDLGVHCNWALRSAVLREA